MLESGIEEIRKNADLRSQQFRTQELKYMQEVDELHTQLRNQKSECRDWKDKHTLVETERNHLRVLIESMSAKEKEFIEEIGKINHEFEV
jgi:hypothetical protein